MGAMMPRLAAVVLAAGGSSRLGSPKQLVSYQGRPLVARAAEAALMTGADPVVLVLGANAATVVTALSGIQVIAVVNPDWKSGMGTSVAIGVSAIVDRAPAVGAVLLMVADQPLVGNAALGRLLERWTSSNGRSGSRGLHATIAAAAYAGTVGVPAVFGRAHFEALCSLPADAGAARLLRQAGAQVRRVAMPEAGVDVDTPNDLARLREGAA
jgi:molybdenum cofactor cytidylyltransferase